MKDATVTAVREAIEYAPEFGPFNPDMRGIWLHGEAGEWWVCSPCIGRITARGCGYTVNRGERVWHGDATPIGVCCCCGK